MAGRQRTEAVELEEEETVELNVVLVDKSFVSNQRQQQQQQQPQQRQRTDDVRLTVVTVQARPSEKIASLKAALRRMAQRTPLSVYYRGIRCAPFRTVGYYWGLGSGGLWQARLMEHMDHTQSRVALDILNDSKKIVLTVPSSLSIGSLKDIIHHRLGFPPEEQHLVIDNKTAKGNASLEDYTKRRSSTSMTLLYEPDNGADVSMKHVQLSRHFVEHIRRSKRSEEIAHCEIVSGLNIEGVCCTPSCRVFGQHAIYALGHDVFDMCLDGALCPLCGGQMYITNAGFHDCVWRIQGVKKNGDNLLVIKPIERETGDEYVRCDPSKCRTPGRWHRLLLQAVSLKSARQCAVCHSRTDTDDIVTSLCGEFFHPSCYQAWKQVDSRCPSCLQQLDT